MSEPLEHVLRVELPWRQQGTKTECGRLLADASKSITRDEFVAKVKRQGQQRAALTTCMTCWHTCRNWLRVTWEEWPVQVLQREAGAALYGKKESVLAGELHAIAALIDAHREEFDGYLAGLSETIDLSERRLRRAR